jgi:hypothetical protein
LGGLKVEQWGCIIRETEICTKLNHFSGSIGGYDDYYTHALGAARFSCDFRHKAKASSLPPLDIREPTAMITVTAIATATAAAAFI